MRLLPRSKPEQAHRALDAPEHTRRALGARAEAVARRNTHAVCRGLARLLLAPRAAAPHRGRSFSPLFPPPDRGGRGVAEGIVGRHISLDPAD
jgi:hypothetical protein